MPGAKTEDPSVIDYDEDDDDFGPYEQFCDCADEEWDLLDCTAKCWSCGNRRNLSTKEVDDYWRGQAEFEKAMSRLAWRDRFSQIWAIIKHRLLFWRRKPPFDLDDEIPF